MKAIRGISIICALSVYFQRLHLSSPVLQIMALAFAIMLAGGTQAANIQVNVSGDTFPPASNDLLCTLREAITNANTNTAVYPDCNAGSGDDRIIFTSALNGAAFTPLIALPFITDNLIIDGAGQNITIFGTNGRAITIEATTIEVELKGLIITGGDWPIGGGIKNNASLTLTSCLVTGNEADSGGGVYNNGILEINSSFITGNKADNGAGLWNDTLGKTTLRDSVVSGNAAARTIDDSFGGGILNKGTMVLINTEVHSNTVTGGADGIGHGGGIYNTGSLQVILQSHIHDNEGNKGAGIYHWSSLRMDINNSTISRNQSKNGGGIYSAGPAYVTNSTITGNRSEGSGVFVRGGGIENMDKLHVYNSTISNNIADSGGGISTVGTLEVLHSTISGNIALDEGGGIKVQPFSGSAGPWIIANSIVAENLSPDGPDCNSRYTVVMLGVNLFKSTSGCSDIAGPLPIIAVPLLGPLFHYPVFVDSEPWLPDKLDRWNLWRDARRRNIYNQCDYRRLHCVGGV